VVSHNRMMPCKDRVLPPWLKTLKDKSEDNVTPHTCDSTPYCVCRKPWSGRFMIQCDFCSEWYHVSYVNVSASDALNIDKCTNVNPAKMSMPNTISFLISASPPIFWLV